MLPGRAFSADAEPVEGMPVIGSSCRALGCGMACASAPCVQKLVGLVPLSKDLGRLGGERSNAEAIKPELQPSSVERRPKSARRPTPNMASSTGSSFAEACERGHDAEQQHVLALRALMALHRMLLQPMGSRSSISSPADGHKAVGLSFTGLVGLVSALAGCAFSPAGFHRQL